MRHELLPTSSFGDGLPGQSRNLESLHCDISNWTKTGLEHVAVEAAAHVKSVAVLLCFRSASWGHFFETLAQMENLTEFTAVLDLTCSRAKINNLLMKLAKKDGKPLTKLELTRADGVTDDCLGHFTSLTGLKVGDCTTLSGSFGMNIANLTHLSKLDLCFCEIPHGGLKGIEALAHLEEISASFCNERGG